MTVNTPSKDDGRGLRERLEDIPRGRLVDEVVSRWDDMIRLEGEIASLRRRVREAELVAKGPGTDGALVSDLEERLRVADSRVRQLEGWWKMRRRVEWGLRQMLVGSQTSRRRIQGF